LKKNVGKILNLYIATKSSNNRDKKEFIILDKYGIIGDKFYKSNINRSILITSEYSYDLINKNNINVDYGILGENIHMDFNPYKLPIGTKLKIADVVLEISQLCTICDHLKKFDKNLPNLIKNDRGIFVKVIEEGTISKDDDIYLMN